MSTETETDDDVLSDAYRSDEDQQIWTQLAEKRYYLVQEKLEAIFSSCILSLLRHAGQKSLNGGKEKKDERHRSSSLYVDSGGAPQPQPYGCRQRRRRVVGGGGSR
jgi:hypothetical protein